MWRFWHFRGYLRGEGRSWLEGFASLEQRGGQETSVEEEAGRALALRGAGGLAVDQGEYAQATVLIGEHGRIPGTGRQARHRRTALIILGYVARDLGDFARDIVLHVESLALRREIGDTWGIALFAQ